MSQNSASKPGPSRSKKATPPSSRDSSPEFQDCPPVTGPTPSLKAVQFRPGGARGIYVLVLKNAFTFIRDAPEYFVAEGAPVNLSAEDGPNIVTTMVSFLVII